MKRWLKEVDVIVVVGGFLIIIYKMARIQGSIDMLQLILLLGAIYLFIRYANKSGEWESSTREQKQEIGIWKRISEKLDKVATVQKKKLDSIDSQDEKDNFTTPKPS